MKSSIEAPRALKLSTQVEACYGRKSVVRAENRCGKSEEATLSHSQVAACYGRKSVVRAENRCEEMREVVQAEFKMKVR